MISEHFSREELETTNKPFDNTCPDKFSHYAVALAEGVLEPLRVILGPLHVNSWFRSPEVNKAVGGGKNSAHLEARAADVVPQGNIYNKFKMALTLLDELPIDQIIHEKNGSAEWIHIGIARDGMKPRKQALICRYVNGKPNYEIYHV